MKSINDFSHKLREGAIRYGISLDDKTIACFKTYTNLVSSWNLRMSLISKRDVNRFVEYHILDSLKLASRLNMLNFRSVLDFGSGAGLPGIPLALAFPHLSVTLVDSRLKKCLFLEEVLKIVPVINAMVIRSRIESLPVKFNGFFDMIITRATVNLSQFFLQCARFVSQNGTLVAIKGDNVTNELEDLHNIDDSRFFNIFSTVPASVENVRKGTIIFITRQ